MKPGWICTSHEHKTLRLFHQQRMLCSYVQKELCTRVGFGVNVLRPYKISHHLKVFGWKDSGELLVKWVPHWTTEAEASKECREFVKCACTTVCGSSARCTCKGADFKCTLLFKCKCTDKLAYD